VDIILASTSATRQSMLRSAGVTPNAVASGVDEAPIKLSFREAGQSSTAAAMALAREKALAVSARHPDALVIGADQILDCEGRWFDKPADLPAAAEHLRKLSARVHRLETAVVCAVAGACRWEHSEAPELKMRPLSDKFIAAYVESESDQILHSVGAYRLEGLGIQLFERIDGDFFTILGLPLLRLLAFLRQSGALPS
jgi:septum formation protein